MTEDVSLAPIIVTALFGAADQAFFDAERRAYFPPERNQLAAHLTMFHHLPPTLAPELRQRLVAETRGIPAPLLSRLSVHHVQPPPASAFEGTLAGLLAGIAADIGCPARDLPALGIEAQRALKRSFAQHRNLRRLRAQIEECLGIAAEEALQVAH